jgi:hypothetical protein
MGEGAWCPCRMEIIICIAHPYTGPYTTTELPTILTVKGRCMALALVLCRR